MVNSEATPALPNAAASHTGSQVGVAVFGRDGRLLTHTPSLARLLSLTPDALVAGRKVADILKPLCDVSNGLPTSSAVPIRCVTSQGRPLELSFEALPRLRCCMTAVDVTDARRTEDDLHRARAAAESASEAKSRFLATMSHELRTPLNAVIGFSEALNREAEIHGGAAEMPNAARVAEFAGAIQEAGQHLLTLINNILDVARVESGRFDLAADLIEIDHLVQGSVRLVQPGARAAEVVIRTDIDPSLPRLRGDERRLRQVLAHLLSNALKFTHAGGQIIVRAERLPSNDGDLLIHVIDNGIGIADHDIDRVFEPFSQLDAGLARKAPGAGLGLYFSRALIQAHGGTLTLASQLGYGTTATLSLPGLRLEAMAQTLEFIQETP